MRTRWVALLTPVVLLLAAPWLLAEEAAATRPRNITLFGWDGAQREHVMECLEKGELPTLKQVASEGKLVKIDIRGTTDTKAGWSQILTGYDPDVTGVYSNNKYQAVPVGLSIFERLEEHFGKDNFATVAVIGKKGHCGEIDEEKKTEITGAAAKGKKGARKDEPGSKIIEEGGKKYRVVPAKPYANMHKACDVWVFGLELDEKVGEKAIEMLDKHKDKPFFFFVHFAQVDHKGHKFGENSKEYNDALISNDTWTGKIIQKVKDLGLYDKTLVYITADHGFDEDKSGHGNAPRVVLATNDKLVMRDGDRADVGPTILERFGVDLSRLQPPLVGVPLTKPVDKPRAQATKGTKKARRQ